MIDPKNGDFLLLSESGEPEYTDNTFNVYKKKHTSVSNRYMIRSHTYSMI